MENVGRWRADVMLQPTKECLKRAVLQGEDVFRHLEAVLGHLTLDDYCARQNMHVQSVIRKMLWRAMIRALVGSNKWRWRTVRLPFG